jgi:hypothetical protein
MEMMIGMIRIFLVAIALCCATMYAIFASCYHDHIKGYQTLTYKQFLRISCVAPEKWKIDDWVYCRIDYKTDDGNTVSIYMKSYFDCLRLARVYNKHKSLIQTSHLANERAKLIKSWQKDINNYHDDYLEQIGVYLKKGKKL